MTGHVRRLSGKVASETGREIGQQVVGAGIVLALGYALLAAAVRFGPGVMGFVRGLDGWLMGIGVVAFAVSATALIFLYLAFLGCVLTAGFAYLTEVVEWVLARVSPRALAVFRVLWFVTVAAWMVGVGTVGIGAFLYATLLAPHFVGVAGLLPLPEAAVTTGNVSVLLWLVIISPVVGGKAGAAIAEETLGRRPSVA